MKNQIPVATKMDEKKGAPIVEALSNRSDAVRQKAFDLSQQRSGAARHDLDDWFDAEREVFGRSSASLKERNGNYEIEVALAGFAPADIGVVADRAEVIVRASSQHAASDSDASVIWSEFGSTELFRRFSLPEAIDVEGVSARFENGLLSIRAPKAEQPSPDVEVK